MYNLLLLDGVEGGGGGAVRAPVGEPLLVAHRDGEPEHQKSVYKSEKERQQVVLIV
jgi:hypothetical protein